MTTKNSPVEITSRAFSKAIAVFDIDGVIRDVGGSYRRALADTVEHFTNGNYRPTPTDIDSLKSEGLWNNDWEGSQEFIYRFFESQGQSRNELKVNYENIVAFFQSRYRGPDPENWSGYICHEPLLVELDYWENLTNAGIPWGFFSGATRASASYVLEQRLGLQSPTLIAMEDAPGKPDPTGLFATIERLGTSASEISIPVLYAGDTVADMHTIAKAKSLFPQGTWIAVGILPPHTQETVARQEAYTRTLTDAGASTVLSNIQELSPEKIQYLLENRT